MEGPNETIADIIAELRERGECRERSPVVYDYADRLEAAYKRERGDCAKLREALKRLITEMTANYADEEESALWCDISIETIRRAKAALAAPPRNCDRFGGDIDKLREACARERGLNPEEDFPDVFPDWLLATATEGGAK